MKRNTLPDITSAVAIGMILIAGGIVFASGTTEIEPESTNQLASIETLLENAEPMTGVARFATGFRAYTHGDLTLIEVTRPWQNADPEDTLRYALYPRENARPEIPGADLVIGVPVESIVTMSTTFLPHIIALEALPQLAAIDMVDFVYAPGVRDRAASGDILEVGSGPGVDIELMLAINPEITMVNSYGGDFDAQPALEEAGIPVIVIGDWVETTPLGRAEWLLVTSLLMDDLDRGLEVFRSAEREYQRLSSLALGAEDKPTVLVNAPFQGTWALPGGESYAAQFVRDAGGDYVYSDNGSVGALFYDIETVFAEAGDADVWINTGVWESLAQGAAEDSRFEEFKAFETGRVYNNNRRLGPGGGNDYFESGAINPHVVLADLIWVFHPELVPDYEPFYYQRLE